MSNMVQSVGRVGRDQGILWIFIGTGIRAVGQLLLMWTLVKTQGPQGVGAYGVAVAWVVPVTAFASLDLLKVQATDHNEAYSLGEYILLRSLTSLVAFGVILAEAVYLGGETAGPIFGLGTLLIVAAMAEVFQGRILQKGDRLNYGKSVSAVNAALWIISAMAMFLVRDMLTAFLLGAATASIVTIFMVIPKVEVSTVSQGGATKWSPLLWRRVASLFRVSLPLGVALFIDSMTTQIPRLYLDAYAGTYTLGILVGLLAFLSIGVLGIEAIGQSLTPAITRLVQRHQSAEMNRMLASVTVGFSVLLILVVSGAYSVGPVIAGFALEESYRHYPLALAAIGATFCLQLMQRVFAIAVTAARLTDHLLILNLIAFFVAIIVGWILIPRLGVTGAAFTLAASNGARSIYYVILLRRTIRLADGR